MKASQKCYESSARELPSLSLSHTLTLILAYTQARTHARTHARTYKGLKGS